MLGDSSFVHGVAFTVIALGRQMAGNDLTLTVPYESGFVPRARVTRGTVPMTTYAVGAYTTELSPEGDVLGVG